GNTWAGRTRVNGDTGVNDQWQPSIQVSPDGTRLAIGWYDRRLDTATPNGLIDYFARTATIAGTTVTFRPEVRINTQSFAPVFGRDTPVNTVYMGDYDDSTRAATNTQFHFTWADNRLGGPDIRTAPVGVNTTGPEVISTTPTGTVPSASSMAFVSH